ncbi:conserved hypothetical protein [Sporisorium reilianum SRZ2]|uniref:FAD synthase n=1 Tax=Sporisorium reilianum (strain SRZ2) TaxID=999809 RepID=E6ZMX7_SPORE|nr:conserved hypothetical protein [Sporisorium reilianum SRZ2]
MASNGTHTSSSDAASSSTAQQQSSPPPPEWIASIDAVYSLFEDPAAAQQYPELSQKVKNAVKLCEEVIQDVGQQHCALSFNGGKDCTVLVHILSAVLRRLAGRGDASSSAPIPSIPSLYITCPSPFPTVEKFIQYCVSPTHGYNLQVISVAGGMKQGIRTYLDGGGREQVGIPPSESPLNDPVVKPRDIRAIFVGTRRDDPHGPQLAPRSWTDNDWPRVERIHPILDWTYQDVWRFLRCAHLASSEAALAMPRQLLAERCGTAGAGAQGVPYCLLYDQGYTSLGSTYNTRPNPELRVGSGDDSAGAAGDEAVLVGDGTAKGRWRPAYMLQDGGLERAGRVEGAQPAAAAPS